MRQWRQPASEREAVEGLWRTESISHQAPLTDHPLQCEVCTAQFVDDTGPRAPTLKVTARA